MLAKLERGEKMSNEAKVGIFTTIGLALLIGIIVYLSGFSFGKEKTILLISLLIKLQD